MGSGSASTNAVSSLTVLLGAEVGAMIIKVRESVTLFSS